MTPCKINWDFCVKHMNSCDWLGAIVYGLYQSVSRPMSACGSKCSWHSTFLGHEEGHPAWKTPLQQCIKVFLDIGKHIGSHCTFVPSVSRLDIGDGLVMDPLGYEVSAYGAE